MEYETAGDPMTDLKWTRKTAEKIADEMTKVGIDVSESTVRRILKNLNFSLKTNVKSISNGGKKVSPESQLKRDSQFNYIKKIRKKFEKKKLPSISVDTKKKEPIGHFKNPGTRLKRGVDLTYDHDFITYAKGQAVLYGIYDDQKNRGFVVVGEFLRKENAYTSSDTPEFAVAAIEKWWQAEGKNTHREGNEILILADSGGSNGYRPHMWKVKLQECICNKHGLKVTVCHYPPGASKWNPIEHRLFSEISKNWRGTPLIDFETVLKYIRTTKTKAGMRVRATSSNKEFKKGAKATKEQIENLNIKRHKINPEWNYTLSPVC